MLAVVRVPLKGSIRITIRGIMGLSIVTLYLPLVSREWKNGSNSSYNCTPFPHSLLTKGRQSSPRRALWNLVCILAALSQVEDYILNPSPKATFPNGRWEQTKFCNEVWCCR